MRVDESPPLTRPDGSLWMPLDALAGVPRCRIETRAAHRISPDQSQCVVVVRRVGVSPCCWTASRSASTCRPLRCSRWCDDEGPPRKTWRRLGAACVRRSRSCLRSEIYRTRTFRGGKRDAEAALAKFVQETENTEEASGERLGQSHLWS